MHRFLKTYFYPVLPKPWGISRGGRDSNGRMQNSVLDISLEGLGV